MDLAELGALLTPEGLRLLDATDGIRTTAEAAAAVSRLRAAGHSPDLVSAVVGQARLRVKAEAKFGPFAERMLFTRAGLEQATRLSVAARHAARFRAAGSARVADLGCGIGGDALGLAALGIEVDAVDADEVTAAIAAYNLAPFGSQVRVHHGTAQAFDTAAVDAVWLDPARRTAGHSETTRVGAADWSPPLEWVFDLAGRLPAGIKLGPAFDRDALPADAEAQWISVDGSTIELVVWTGALARPGIHRAALVVRGDATHELTAAADAADEPVRDLGAFVHEPDGAVIRARLIGEVARELHAGMLAPGMAYLTGDAAVTSPFVSSFRVREQLPSDVKGLAKALRERGIGTLEIKKRGVDVDPAALRTKLKLKGAESATLLITRIGTRRLTLLADRVG
ncbi:SAM-dependent methyltransferase [Microbacterium sp. Sa4CUA7]|uniref:SAM-dependent methyltransferase n=1 Tax=Microbacterium pullorum TaxID=2762236 RepID=A0ABR8S4Y2_9MICO|nr:class I SAM-dependent methyltransferase [Microbacterium pullorum]MBD7958527.1 SAM-dependent methyltransferase [Microbacterium pullorum]